MRLRLHLSIRFNSEATELKAKFRGRRITIKSRTTDEPLKQAEWVVILAKRFTEPEAAAQFGFDIQASISAIFALRSMPIDVGFDNVTTAAFGDVVKDAVAKTGTWLIDDVHGVDVYPDTGASIITVHGANLTAYFDPIKVTEPLRSVGKKLACLDTKGKEASLLLNAAYMAPHPVATVTLAVAAVELLAANERWNENQKRWIKGLREHLAESDTLSAEERNELRKAIDNLNNFGALGRTRRLLKSLDLEDLSDRWEELYRKRSRLFHGDKIISFPQLQTLGSEARTISQSVVQAYIERATGVKLT